MLIYPDNNYYSGTSFSSDLEASISLPGDNILLLTKRDVPGSSLNSMDPAKLNVVNLKRWLACRGALVTGKKPSLLKGK